MEPQVRYTRTSDGVSIAYATSGSGRALVQLPPIPMSQIQMATRFEEDLAWMETLGAGGMFVRYDARGTGLSERSVSDFSLEAHVRDLDAVVGELEKPVMLWGQLASGAAAVAFAARHPEAVSHLVLWSSWADSGKALDAGPTRALMGLASADWQLFTETSAQALSGWSAGELAHRTAEFFREGTDPDVGRAMIEAIVQFDVSSDLNSVECPTLVLQPAKAAFPDIALARQLAAGIPEARLVILDGPPALTALEEKDTRTLHEFLGVNIRNIFDTRQPGTPNARSVTTVLFTDLVGHTEMMQRLGDEKGREVLREHERITRGVLKANGGTEVKTMGDGFMASFGSVTKAVECAIALQRAFDEHNRGDGAQHAAPLQVRCGLNAGEPIEEDGDLFGSTVILASRVAAKAEGGEILASLAVRELCSGKGFLFADRGEFVAKGFEEPVRVFEVRWRE
jgi:class 3 adenylate cyclase